MQTFYLVFSAILCLFCFLCCKWWATAPDIGAGKDKRMIMMRAPSTSLATCSAGRAGCSSSRASFAPSDCSDCLQFVPFARLITEVTD